MTTPWRVEWFTVSSGRRAGERHISGWCMTAIDGCRLGVCPVCGALVPANEGLGLLDTTWMHEQWHAANGFPDPESGCPECPHARARHTAAGCRDCPGYTCLAQGTFGAR